MIESNFLGDEMSSKVDFRGNIFMIGCGVVARCTLPLVLKHINIPVNKITILDMADNKAHIKYALEQGASYIIQKITPDNLTKILTTYTKTGDLIIDLAYEIDCCELLQWCHDNNVFYINSSIEVWDPNNIKKYNHPTQRTLYSRHMKIQNLIKSWGNNNGSTAVLEHGANPGLVSHFTKDALITIANKIINEKPNDQRLQLLKEAILQKDFAKIAQLIGLKVVHISERDTQITNDPKKVDEFVNTWSIEGLIEEGSATSELGWGTHEKELPKYTYLHDNGPKNQICIAQMGIKTFVYSWVPTGQIIGMVIRHGEAFTISNKLTVWKNDQPIYRPTVNYAYLPTDSTMNSLHELIMNNMKLQAKKRILADEIINGADELGVLLMGHDFTSWWTGSYLDINQTRKLIPGQNATTLQVAASVIAAIIWIIKNPKKGVCVPDDLPHEEILEIAKPYLGKYISVQSDWTPLKDRVNLFENYGKNTPSKEDLWQFKTFLFD